MILRQLYYLLMLKLLQKCTLFLGFLPIFQSIVPFPLIIFSKLELPLVIEFWDLIVADDNVLNIFFFSVALLITHR
jgi:hypothetical protein